MTTNKRRWLPFVVILFLWGVLYLPHLSKSPSWYVDETSALMIGRDLFHGKPAVHAIVHTPFFQSYPSQPVYSWLTGVFAWMFEDDLWGGRFFNALLALAAACLMAGWGSQILGRGFALAAAVLFLGYEQSLIHFRSVFPHNGVALGLLVMTLFLCRKASRSNDLKAGMGLALAAGAHPLAVYGVPVAVLSRLKKPVSWFWIGILPAVVVGITLLVSWLAFPKWVPGDLVDMAGNKYAGDIQNHAGLFFGSVVRFVLQDWFHAGGFVAGILCLFKCRTRPVGIGVLVLSACLLLNRANLTVFYYQAVVLLPLLALSWGVLLRKTVAWFAKTARRKIQFPKAVWKKRAHVGIMALVLLTVCWDLPQVWSGRLTPRNAFWTTQRLADVEAAADWLNQQTSKDSLVIANTNLAWLLDAKTGDWLQAVAWAGEPTFMFERGVPRERFRYELDVRRAKYAVMGDMDFRWTAHQPNVQTAMAEVQENWPVVWRSATYVIWRNPDAAL